MERCSFILKKKNRKCRMLVRNGQKYCGEHAICDEQNKDRIICPNDPRHTVNKSQLQKHLSSRCNSRLPEVPWIVKNFNLAGSPNEVEPWYRPSNDGFLRIRKIVERIYNQIANDITDSFLKNDYVENCASSFSKLNKKHIWQISSIIEHLRIIDLLNNDKRWCMIDFGTGRAQLSYWMAKIAPKCRFLLIEKMGSRNKFDNKIHKELDLVFLKRLRCSVEHLDLSKIDLIRDVDNTAAVCKHFCGAATDFGIRCLMNGVKSGLNVHGFVLAPCCHHRTTYKEYIGRAFLEFHGICSSNEFAALRHISTWAVCSFLNQENLDGNVSVSSHSLKSENLGQQEAKLEFMSLSSVEKELLGQKAKAVLEFGRVVELRNNLDLLRGSGLNSVSGPETSEEQKKRFEIECEFVQALANPHYLNFLAQRGYFKEPYFINYLKYLLYWKRPEYARALKYPQCLHFLEAVQSSAFREAITCTANAKFIEEQQCIQRNTMMTNKNGSSSIHNNGKKLQRHLPNFIALFFALSIVYSKSFVIIAEPTVDLPSSCESCVLFAREFQEQLANDRDVKISAVEKELKFVEALEGTCERMLQYKLHKEKSDISRFAKEESNTMKALNELRSKGVKVELGIPYEMWDTPSVEIVTLKQNCETLLERYENDLEQWYNIRNRPLLEEYLCKKRVLKRTERGCMEISDLEL
uniref:tRNA:m(4)X modification enzyme TRM13 n=1 Tax=Wuchereria bancrofti TaxID=6293 RepID=A0AAF5PKH0_WUCBA